MSTQPTALAQLRHLYKNMLNGGVRDTASAKRIAEGLLGPAIEALERGTPATGGEPVGTVVHNTAADAQFAPRAVWPLNNFHDLPLGTKLYTSPQPVREPSHVPHTCAGFVGAYVSLNGRQPSQQDVWGAAIRSYRDLHPSPQSVRVPLSTVELMRVVMKADEESQDTRGTTNWAAHIGKAVQNAVLGITGGQHG